MKNSQSLKFGKIIIFLFLIILIGISVGCSTIIEKQSFPLHFNDDDVEASLFIISDSWVSLNIINKSDYVITLITDLSSFNYNSRTYRLIPEGTKYIDATRSQPNFVIAPKTSFSKQFTAAESIYYVSGAYSNGWNIKPWIPEDLSQAIFLFGISINNISKFITFKGDEIVKVKENYTIVGTAYAEKIYWNIFFISQPIQNKKNEVYNICLRDSIAKYGEDIILMNLKYESTWQIASMLLYFSMLGYVEKFSLSAEIWKPKK